MERAFAAERATSAPRRFVAITLGLGLHAEYLNPTDAGADYQPSMYLKHVDDLRKHYTVISGSSHPGVSGGHRAEASLLTAAPMSASAQSRNTISVDQLLAKHLGDKTRFPSLVLGLSGSNSPSYTENGAMIPAIDSPAELFTRLFIDDSPRERRKQAQRAREGRASWISSRRMRSRLNASWAREIASGWTPISRACGIWRTGWLNRKRGSTGRSRRSTFPADRHRNPNDFVGRQRLMSDMVKLAVSTDSSRYITLQRADPGVSCRFRGWRRVTTT